MYAYGDVAVECVCVCVGGEVEGESGRGVGGLISPIYLSVSGSDLIINLVLQDRAILL